MSAQILFESKEDLCMAKNDSICNREREDIVLRVREKLLHEV
ncbi:MAG: hypothetical protein P6H82_01295 [Candidatus Arsenophonus melophagi]|nr:hypothetical protein [Candidatus Arsenophonus melophagi]